MSANRGRSMNFQPEAEPSAALPPAASPPVGTDLADAIEAMGIGLAVLDPARRIRWASTAFCARIGVVDPAAPAGLNLPPEFRLLPLPGGTGFAALMPDTAWRIPPSPDRAALGMVLERALAAGEPSRKLIRLDLDAFRNVNDSLGQRMGDRVLDLVAVRLEQALTPADTLLRMPSDEFAVLTAPDGAGVAVEQLLEAVRAPFDLEGQRLYLTASAGVALWPQDGMTAETLLACADMALNQAKARGRNRWVAFSPALRASILRLIEVTQALRRGLADRHLRLVLQPRLDLARGRLCGAEALLRWSDPVLGEIGPEEFIPLAETAGLIRAVDTQVVELLGAMLARWRRHGGGPPVSFNLSARSLQGEQFARILLDQFAAAGILPGEAVIELTETGLVDTVEPIRRNLAALRAAGFATAIDDFGTGYSSLSHLQHLPFSELKIDRSFTARLGQGDRAADSIVGAILAMAGALGMRTVAERVETAVQRDWLAAAGCAEGQGLFFAPPLEVAAFEARWL